jgi:ABC-type sugar transport system ATPase subunit
MNFLLPEAARPFFPVPQGIVVGVRPEHVRIVPNGVLARVEIVEVAGSDAFVHVDRGLISKLPADGRPAEGAEVGIAIDRAGVHLFDEASGERMEWT